MSRDPQVEYGAALGGLRGRDVAGLLGAGVAVLALHAGIAAWALQRPEISSESPGTAAAVMIDFAPETRAPAAMTEQISDQMRNIAPSLAPPEAPKVEPLRELPPPFEPMIRPEPVPPEAPAPKRGDAMMPPAPPPPVAEPEIETVEVEARVPRPRRRAGLQALTEEAPRRPVRERAPAASAAAARAASVKASPAPVAAAPKTSTRTQGRAANAQWAAELRTHIERHKPPLSESGGRQRRRVALVRFVIDDAGNVTRVALVESSGVAQLDRAAVALLQRASPVPAPPPGSQRVITLPVRFDPP